MCCYGTYLNGTIVYSIIQQTQIFHKNFFDLSKNKHLKPTYRLVFRWLIENHRTVTCLTLIAAIMSVVLCIFCAWHTYLIINNMTTNEKSKYRHLKNFMQWRLENSKKDNTINSGKKTPDISDTKKTVNKNHTNETVNKNHTNKKNKNKNRSKVGYNKNDACKQINQHDATSNSNNSVNNDNIGQRLYFKDYDMNQWSKVNIYNKGFSNNLLEVYQPFSNINNIIQDNHENNEEIGKIKKRQTDLNISHLQIIKIQTLVISIDYFNHSLQNFLSR